MRILVVEDNPRMAGFLAKGLREQTYAVDVATDGEQALYQSSINGYDLIVLDIALPQVDGLEVCRRLREAGSKVLILMLTARDGVDDRIAGLDCGADDYISKPFAFGELLARVRALLRRGEVPRSMVLSVGDLTIRTTEQRVFRHDVAIDLTSKEYALLEFFARNAERVIGRAEISDHVWDEGYDPMSNLIEVYVQRLRKKLGEPAILQTRRGSGYVLTASRPYGTEVIG